jgi:hypothetical protein
MLVSYKLSSLAVLFSGRFFSPYQHATQFAMLVVPLEM